jgi:hypothetical protein
MINLFKKTRAEGVSLSEFIATMDEIASAHAKERDYKQVAKRRWAKTSMNGDFIMLLSLNSLKGASYYYSLEIQPTFTPDVIESIKVNSIVQHPKPFAENAFKVNIGNGNSPLVHNGLDNISWGKLQGTNELKSMMANQIKAIDILVKNNSSLDAIIGSYKVASASIDFLFARALTFRAAGKVEEAEAFYHDFNERLEMQSITTSASKKIFRDYYSELLV